MTPIICVYINTYILYIVYNMQFLVYIFGFQYLLFHYIYHLRIFWILLKRKKLTKNYYIWLRQNLKKVNVNHT